MRRRIAWVVAGATSAVVLIFVIPLFLLVQSLAEDRGMAAANEEARNVAILVSGLHDSPTLPDLVSALDRRSPAVTTSVLTAQGVVLGAPAPDIAEDADVLQARTGRAFTARGEAGGKILVPVITAAGTDVVRTTVSTAVLRAGVGTAWAAIAALGVVLFVAAVLIAAQLGRRVSTPVTEVAAVAHRLREGDLAARAVPTGPPETRELGEALNRLAERITELLAAERAAVGDLSHRLRTPVTALRLDAESVRDAELAERLQRHIASLQRTIDAIVREARRPVRSDMQSTCDATAVVAERVQFWSALAEDQGRAMEVDLPDEPRPVSVDASDLRDIVDVLVDNVFAHTPEGTAFSVALSDAPPDAAPDVAPDAVLTAPSAGWAGPALIVADEGPGPSPVAADQRERTGFSGLGLQIVRRTVTGFGGRMRLASVPGAGTEVVVQLPSAAASTSRRHGQWSSDS
ncbi:HAMP domain-containing sensor histidine kinase [Intrasporangium sp.]|uniref:sensor histidine kinase n=1 Tax=Intrasporangium sp. TaxID=1925024 RepID=UPI002939769B|nr:HAMP domain-containing sensor histidine kinase [Intrasporangium sp.]MDV3222298.1 HAMP domain-containing histidine kinase [Intrasporangium sp.]